MQRLFDQITAEDNVRLAVELTLNDLGKEMFCNPIQIEHCRINQNKYIKLTRDRLLDYKNYESRVSIRALKRKNDFALRNFIIPDIEDNIARMAVVLPLANELEAKLIDNCFSNRRGEQIKLNNSLTEDYAKHGWPKFCEWQAVAVKNYNLLLKTDLSSFFDSVCHEHLINAIRKEFGIPSNDPLTILLKQMLKVKHAYSGFSDPKEVIHGITIGPLGNHVLANLLLNEIDHIMLSMSGIEYGRYVDDIRIFASSKQKIKTALNTLQMKLYEIGLNLNGAKTQFAGNTKLLNKLLSEKFFTYLDEEDIGNYRSPSPKRESEIVSDMRRYHDSKVNDVNKPFTTDYRDLASWKRVKVMSRSDLKKEYIQSINNTLRIDPGKINHTVVNRLIRFICDDPDNEKFACWLLSGIVTSPGITKLKRKKYLRKALNLMLSKDVTSYAIYRILYFLSYQSRYPNFDYSVVNSSFSVEMKSDFYKLIKFCINNDRLILNLIGLFAMKSYNDNHTKAMRIKARLKRDLQVNSIWENNLSLIKKTPKMIQPKIEVSELQEIIESEELLDGKLKDVCVLSGVVIEKIQS